MNSEPSAEAWRRAGDLIAAALTQLAYDDAEAKLKEVPPAGGAES